MPWYNAHFPSQHGALSAVLTEAGSPREKRYTGSVRCLGVPQGQGFSGISKLYLAKMMEWR